MIAPKYLKKWLLPALAAIVLAGCSAPILTQDIVAQFEPGGKGMPAYYSLDLANGTASEPGIVKRIGPRSEAAYEEALRELRPLAEQGDSDAQTAIGVMYVNGQGVPQDHVQAARWFRLAAEQGNIMALYNLGTTYRLGRGVPQDYVQAHKWYSLADSLSFAYTLRNAEDRRDDVASKMTPAEIAEAKRLEREWRRKR